MSTIDIGSSVVVKDDTFDSDLKTSITGWEGRVISIEEESVLTIAWDSITLKAIPKKVIDFCEEEEINWEEITLSISDLNISQSRDTEKDVSKIVEELKEKHYWSHLGEQGRRVKFVLGTTDRDDLLEAHRVWGVYLQKMLELPFTALVADELAPESPVQQGNIVKVVGIEGYDEEDGVLVWIEYKEEEYTLPLFILEAEKQPSKNYELVDDYFTFFDNL